MDIETSYAPFLLLYGLLRFQYQLLLYPTVPDVIQSTNSNCLQPADICYWCSERYQVKWDTINIHILNKTVFCMVTITNKTTLQDKDLKKGKKKGKEKVEETVKNPSIIEQVLRSAPIPRTEHL